MDAADEIFNVRSEKALKNPVKLNVFADRVLVGEFWLDNKMEPLTVTVPIFKCHQLMFWMECGDKRSGQYVFYDLKLSKAPCDIAIPTEYSSGNYDDSHNGDSESTTEVNNNSKTTKKGKKAKQRVTWEVKNYSGDSAVDGYLKDITEIWGKTSKYVEGDYEMPKISETWVQAKDGSVYKCLSFVNSRRQRLSISSMIETLEKRINEGKNIQSSISLARLGVASATLGVATLFSIDKTIYFGKKVKEGPKALTQCEDDISACISLAKAQIDAFNAYRSAAIEVDGKTSSDTVLILRPEKDDNVPNTFERLEYFNF
ncbi:unknown [Bacteroides sp. CAG:1060]|nr:unknown [Bacteroides sp. CAG:1060]